ncbi:MAG: methylglyoxal reductase (NADPH-dependent) gre2 [Cyphobasidiales sp. Tagirdzhanova-0007]|nr:MAG: methylglyoxal reductase (NADPH-dependent) gre2 [Cyphobasidiales sp. Tagirdzhanova-0007]
MPAVQSGLVLVTGASGFLAVHVVKELLSRGYQVRGTVRSKEKGDYLLRKFPSGFEYAIVEDVEAEGGFDQALKGVDAVEHTAAPFHYKAEHPDKVINPAVNGTKNVLKSIQKHGKNVKRVVLTSTFGAIVDLRKKRPHTFTELDWNTDSTSALESKGDDISPGEAYKAGKTLAEKAAWQFVEDNKPKWDLVALNPPFILGPILHQVNAADKLNTSVGQWYAWLTGSKNGDDAAGPLSNVVDVRDLAHAHVQAISLEEAGSKRIAVSNQPYTWQLCLDEVYGNDAVMKSWPKLPKGRTGADKLEDQNLLDNSRSKEILKMTYIPFKKTLLDAAASLAEREASGWSD